MYVSAREPASEARALPAEVNKEMPLRETEFPAAFAPLTRGHVGYVGTFNGAPDATQLLLEMCGVTVTSAESGPETSGGAYTHPNGSGLRDPDPLSLKTNRHSLPRPSEDLLRPVGESGPSRITQMEVRSTPSAFGVQK